MRKNIEKFFDKVERLTLVQAVRRALISLIPVLMIASFALMLESLPIEQYTTFIRTWRDGIIYDFLEAIRSITFGMIAIYMTAVIGYQIGAMKEKENQDLKIGTMLVSVGCFFMLTGSQNGMNTTFTARGMIVAIISASVGSGLYLFISEKMIRRHLLTDGADINLWNAIHSIFPAAVTFGIISLGNNVLLRMFEAESFYEMTRTMIIKLTDHVGQGIGGGLTYVVLNGVLWFLGIHGSDVLEGMVEILYETSAQQNMASILNGEAATAIVTRPFLDDFVMIGGCGATLCLLIALLLFCKRSGTKRLMKMSALPMIFNINEIMVFGLPVIYNPIFLIPFVLVPVVSFFTAYFATWMGWVPVVMKDVEWTTPILINGYMATGSFRGVLLQFVNVVIGVAIYAPFVKYYDKKKAESAKQDYERMLEKFKADEASGTKCNLLDSNSKEYGWMGKALAADLEHAFAHNKFKLYYQPQYNEQNKCVGIEALLRWNHDTLGWIYPPLIFKLAKEVDIQEELEKWVIINAIKDAERVQKKYTGSEIHISVNVTGSSIQLKSFEDFLQVLAVENDVKTLGICLEITEQDALLLDDNLRERFGRLREAGYMLAVDDFSMGSTSIRYLTGSHFGLVKIDGTLVRGILDNPRCSEIIASIVNLSDTLGVDVLAEYVEDEAIRNKLLEVGCRLYQGWYYSPAVPMEEIEEILSKTEK